MQFSLNAQAGGQVVELGGVPDGPAALNIVPDGHLAGPAALVAWASCLEHRDQHLQKHPSPLLRLQNEDLRMLLSNYLKNQN